MRPSGEDDDDDDEDEDEDDDEDARPEAIDARIVRIAPRATTSDDLTDSAATRARVASRRVASRRPMRALRECVNVRDLRARARWTVPKFAFDYLDGGADDEKALARASAAFDELEFHPSTCRGVDVADTTTSFMGHRDVECIFPAPTAGHALWSPRLGETASATACARQNRVFSLSTLGTRSPAEIARETPTLRHKMFQVYVWKDRELMRDVLASAREAGFTSIALTTDLTHFGNRERDLRNGFSVPPKHSLRTALAALGAPRWTAEFLTSKRIEYALLRDLKRDGLLEGSSSIAEFATRQFDATFRWEDAEWFRSQWDGPVALKGVLRADDARRARDAGYDAVWVTSHGARQLESAVAPVDALPSIRRALGDEVEIIYDGGVMRGVDVVKAIARGATAVGVGKAYLYGLAAGGVRGVERAFDFLTRETKRAMALIGVKNVDELRARGDDVVRERRR